MDGMDYCEECEREHREEVKELMGQLKRKEQECERSLKRISDLEERIINHSNEIEEYCSRLADKNKECEELKKNNQILCDLYKNVDSCLQKRTEKFDCYRKALEEIEEQCKCYGRSKYTQEFDREYGGELDTNILDIIDNLKG